MGNALKLAAFTNPRQVHHRNADKHFEAINHPDSIKQHNDFAESHAQKTFGRGLGKLKEHELAYVHAHTNHEAPHYKKLRKKHFGKHASQKKSLLDKTKKALKNFQKKHMTTPAQRKAVFGKDHW